MDKDILFYFCILLQSASYESCKNLSAWVVDLVRRVDFFAEWCELVIRSVDKALKVQPASEHPTKHGAPPPPPAPLPPEEPLYKIQPHSFWLSAFFFPQGKLVVFINLILNYKLTSVQLYHIKPDFPT